MTPSQQHDGILVCSVLNALLRSPLKPTARGFHGRQRRQGIRDKQLAKNVFRPDAKTAPLAAELVIICAEALV